MRHGPLLDSRFYLIRVIRVKITLCSFLVYYTTIDNDINLFHDVLTLLSVSYQPDTEEVILEGGTHQTLINAVPPTKEEQDSSVPLSNTVKEKYVSVSYREGGKG